MRRSVLVLLLLGAGCARLGGVEVLPAEEMHPEIYGAVERERPTRIDFFLVEGNRLAKVTRTGRASRPPHEVAMIQLLRGPTQEELNQKGLTTEIPEQTELLGVGVEDRVVHVDLSADFYRISEPSQQDAPAQRPQQIQSYLLRLAQVVWTMNEITGIDRVQFLKNGIVEPVLDQRRLGPISTPVARGSYRAFEPRVDRSVNVVEQPTI